MTRSSASEDGSTITVQATVVGRSCGEQLSLRTESRGQLSVRVRGRLWLQLDLGDPVWLEIGRDGRPCGIRPATPDDNGVS